MRLSAVAIVLIFCLATPTFGDIMQTGIVPDGYIQDQGTWNLHIAQPPGERHFIHHVDFSQEFTEGLPIVLVTLSGLDSDNAANQRVLVSAENITPKGFDILYKTWWDTRLYGAWVTWEAIPRSGLGIKGDKGDQGPKGDKGDPGVAGANGVMGPQGPAGATGPLPRFGNISVIPTPSDSNVLRPIDPLVPAIDDGFLYVTNNGTIDGLLRIKPLGMPSIDFVMNHGTVIVPVAKGSSCSMICNGNVEDYGLYWLPLAPSSTNSF